MWWPIPTYRVGEDLVVVTVVAAGRCSSETGCEPRRRPRPVLPKTGRPPALTVGTVLLAGPQHMTTSKRQDRIGDQVANWS